MQFPICLDTVCCLWLFSFSRQINNLVKIQHNDQTTINIANAADKAVAIIIADGLCRINMHRIDTEHLGHSIDDHADRDFIDFHDDNACAVRIRHLFQPDAFLQVNDWKHTAAQIDYSLDIFRGKRDTGDIGKVFDAAVKDYAYIFKAKKSKWKYFL